MQDFPNNKTLPVSEIHILLPYVAELELEVDRLRRQGKFVWHRLRDMLRQVQRLSCEAPTDGSAAQRLAEVGRVTAALTAALEDIQDTPGYHPAHDQVIAIAVRPLVEQVFRWQQRLQDVPLAVLSLELESEHVEWFPARLRHILDNLLSNALKYRDPAKTETRVAVGLRVSPESYELRVSDNGTGLPDRDGQPALELFYRAAPTRAAGLGVGLPVVKLLVEQSGGSLTVDSGVGQGTTLVALLPRYDATDYLV